MKKKTLRFIKEIFDPEQVDQQEQEVAIPLPPQPPPVNEANEATMPINQVFAPQPTHMDEVSQPMKESFRQLFAAAFQSIGKNRLHNEDTIFCFTATLAGVVEPLSFGLYIVADGMGGHRCGELASGIACQVAADYLIKNVYMSVLRMDKSLADMDFETHLQKAVKLAHQKVISEVPGGGTTLTVLMIVGEYAFTAHVGDSRLYFFDACVGFRVVTKDHTLVRQLIELGQITEEEAYYHPQRNVLMRALGQGDPFEADVEFFQLTPDCKLLF